METLHILNETELHIVVKSVLEKILERKIQGYASVLALNGDLGAGKTAFTKILARELGVEEEITSPTFVIMKRYEIDGDTDAAKPFEQLVHIDAYRIDDIDEMRPIRLGEILNESNTLVCIEWAERIKELLPAHTLYMNIEIDGEESRTITFA